jgi:hypothetical protein
MARLRWTATTEGERTLVAATAQTLLQVVAPAQQRLALLSCSVSFSGVLPTAEPVLVEILEAADIGTSSAGTPRKDEPSLAETIQGTCRRAFTGEPTTPVVKRQYFVHPQTGMERVYGPDEEIVVQGGGRLGIRATAPAGVDCVASMTVEE